MVKGIDERNQESTERHMVNAFESLHWTEKELAVVQKNMPGPIKTTSVPNTSTTDPHLQQYLINSQ